VCTHKDKTAKNQPKQLLDYLPFAFVFPLYWQPAHFASKNRLATYE